MKSSDAKAGSQRVPRAACESDLPLSLETSLLGAHPRNKEVGRYFTPYTFGARPRPSCFGSSPRSTMRPSSISLLT